MTRNTLNTLEAESRAFFGLPVEEKKKIAMAMVAGLGAAISRPAAS